ncbi:MAG: hypothetical protein ABSD50_08940 [Smithella sp.]
MRGKAMVNIKTKNITSVKCSGSSKKDSRSWIERGLTPAECIEEALAPQPMPANLQYFVKDKKDAAMNFVISVKHGVNFPRNIADLVRNALLEADKDKVAEYIEWLLESKSFPDEFFLSVFTPENRKLLAMLLRGKIKKRRGLKQERGFDDFLIFFHYKELRSNGYTRAKAIRQISKDLRASHKLPKADLFRRASEGRYWKDENIEANVEEIISKLNKIVEITPP